MRLLFRASCPRKSQPSQRLLLSSYNLCKEFQEGRIFCDGKMGVLLSFDRVRPPRCLFTHFLIVEV